MQLFKTALVFVLSFAMVEVTFSLNAQAGMISTSQAVSDRARAENLSTVNSFLNRVDVQDELIKRGVSPEEARSRVAGCRISSCKRWRVISKTRPRAPT